MLILIKWVFFDRSMADEAVLVMIASELRQIRDVLADLYTLMDRRTY